MAAEAAGRGDAAAILVEAGIPEWLAEALDDIARGNPASYVGLLEEVGDVRVLDGTRTYCRCHFVKRDPHGRPVVQKLVDKLMAQIVDYCIPRSKIEEARKHDARFKTTERYMQLGRQARELFVKLDKSGEGGELLLYVLLETLLGIPQLLTKMSLKTSDAMHVHGSDGLHGKVLEHGNLALYWGESKVHKKVSSAIDSCFESVTPYLLDEGGGAARRDLMLLRDYVDPGDARIKTELVKFFDEDEPQSSNVEVRAACLVSFDLAGYPHPFVKARELSEEVGKAIAGWQDRVRSQVSDKKLESFEIEVFCLPLPSVEKFRELMHRQLGGHAPYGDASASEIGPGGEVGEAGDGEA